MKLGEFGNLIEYIAEYRGKELEKMSKEELLELVRALYHTLKTERAQSGVAIANHDYAMAGLVKLCLERMAL